MTALEGKTHEELIEQIRRMQDRSNPIAAGRAAEINTMAKRCADYRKAARLANVRADEAERKLRVLQKAFKSLDTAEDQEVKP